MAERFLALRSVLSPHWVRLMARRGWFPHWGAPQAWRRPEASELCLRRGVGCCPHQSWSWRTPKRAQGAEGLLMWCRWRLRLFLLSLGTWGGLGPGPGLRLATPPSKKPSPSRPGVPGRLTCGGGFLF